MADDVVRKVVGYLRQIEKLAEKGDLGGVRLEARLALRLCNAPSSSEMTSGAGRDLLSLTNEHPG